MTTPAHVESALAAGDRKRAPAKCAHRNSIAVDIDGAGEAVRFCNDCGANFWATARLPAPGDLGGMAAIEQQILALIESSIEDTRVPDAIAAHADKRAGKPVTKTDAEQLEAQLGVPVRIAKRYGMTQIAWAAGKGQHPWSDERSILIAHAESNVRWPDGAALRAKEPAYFGARDERNAARRQLLADHKATICGQTTHSTVARAAAAVAKIREAQAELEKLIDYGEPLYVMRTDVAKLVNKAE